MTLKPIDTPSVGTPTAHSSSGLVQPMFHTASATSDTNGNITFTFGGVFTGQILIGSFSCPSAPYTAQFTAYNNSQEVYSWQSSNNPGPLRVSENQQITVSGTGLVPSTQYVMNWVGYSTVGGFAPQIVPDNHTDVVISTNQGGLQGVEVDAAASTETTLLPNCSPGFAYRIHSFQFQSLGTGATAAGYLVLIDFGTTPSSTKIFSYAWASGQVLATTQLINGLLCQGSIAVYVSTGFPQVQVDLRYDVIQI